METCAGCEWAHDAELRRAKRLECFTLFYNGAEALISVWAGVAAGSVAPTGFGWTASSR
jgi:hypothetical protein